MSKFYELSEHTVSLFKDVFRKKAFSIELDFAFQGNESQKTLIKINKIPEQYAVLLEKSILVTINEEVMGLMDDESITILFEQELDKISVNIDSGKIKLVKPDLTTFSSLVIKYGIEKVSKANSLESLASEQKDDMDIDEFDILTK